MRKIKHTSIVTGMLLISVLVLLISGCSFGKADEAPIENSESEVSAVSEAETEIEETALSETSQMDWQEEEQKIIAAKPPLSLVVNTGLNPDDSPAELEQKLWEIMDDMEGSMNVAEEVVPRVRELSTSEIQRLQEIPIPGEGMGAYVPFGQVEGDMSYWIDLVFRNIGSIEKFSAGRYNFVSHPDLVYGDPSFRKVVRGVLTLQYVNPNNPFAENGVMADALYQIDVEVVVSSIYLHDKDSYEEQINAVRYLSGFREVLEQ